MVAGAGPMSWPLRLRTEPFVRIREENVPQESWEIFASIRYHGSDMMHWLANPIPRIVVLNSDQCRQLGERPRELVHFEI